MNVLQILSLIWVIANMPCGIIAIGIACFVNAEFNDSFDIFIFPLLIRSLREKLSDTGTTLVTILFSILFAPAIITYFIILLCYTIAILIISAFMDIFKRKD